MKRAFAAAVLVLASAGAAQAQTGYSPRVLTLPASVRAAAMGGVFPLAGGDADAVFYNPALVDSGGGVALQAARYGTGATAAGASGAAGPFGLGVQALTYGAPTADAAALPGGDRSLRAQGPVGAGEVAATVAYARKLGGRFRAGAGAKLVQERLGGAQDAGWAVDLGAAARLGPATVGLAARDLGPALEIGGARAPLPARVTLGATLRGQEVGPLDLAAAAEATRLADGRLVPAAGVEVAYWPVDGRTFAARAGVRRGTESGEGARLTLGGGVRWDRLSIDYAWEGLDGAGSGAAHRVGITWR